ncbi:NACHT domain-containing protein [Pseudomonas sp. Pseusp16]|uniref:NACHT domain-containing protein n=1 Tax=Pseudomonas sp. Pseusp16 TaxID=3243021 RepID=UPI0039B3BB90
MSKILPPGTEGGKEFGRIVGLLLLNEAKRNDHEFNLFDDASGDFEGLDGFSRNQKSGEAIGFQYKFFPSPLSDAHRHEITNSLVNAIERNDSLNLTKWVLVTPDDLKNSGVRKNGGDVAWFEKLKAKYEDVLPIEHMGHSRLQDLFLQTHHICLHYYPTLIPHGRTLQKGIKELRAQYNKNMQQRYGKIEFVGMSVYKQEALRRIPLENIYIPLSVVGERQPEETEDTHRINPLNFLTPGSKTVILGDPGSGKSTLLGFLALVGTSKGLQRRCRFTADGRLTIVITLRRYADELKKNSNLSMLDFIRDVAEADFNLTGLTLSFYEYYLESAQAIVLFDGLDELPGQNFKNTIRRRIESFTANYPGNTVVISSRLVGYEAEVRFDESYEHYRVAKLRLDEIMKFIRDWYSVRVADAAERDRSANDLIKVMTSRENDSIRELARNPLLLTIVALVHRIDAVLPDQRVVLYQKCTETLLNTWYKAKRNDDEIIKGRIEQRNRVRVEAIAYWMHTRSMGSEGRSVAEHQELLEFLADHIIEHEHLKDTDEAQDQAEEFLLFIKNSAGLLIEAGDGLYSFIHLTFQEYLCATYLLAFGETKGAQSIWEELNGALLNPRWREVVRLLIASLKSAPAKSFYIDKLIESEHSNLRDTSLLLNGLLRDSIEPAEARAEEIFAIVVKALMACDEEQDIVDLKQSFESLILKDANYLNRALPAWSDCFHRASNNEKIVLVLIGRLIGLPKIERTELEKLVLTAEKKLLLVNLIHGIQSESGPSNVMEILAKIQSIWASQNAETNAASAVCVGLAMLLDPTESSKHIFNRELSLLFTSNHGPHHDHGLNLAAIAGAATDLHSSFELALHNALGPSAGRTKKTVKGIFSATAKEWLSRRNIRGKTIAKFFKAFEDNIDSNNAVHFGEEPDHPRRRRSLDIVDIRQDHRGHMNTKKDLYWERLSKTEVVSQYIPQALELSFDMKLTPIWREVLKHSVNEILPMAFRKYFNPEEWASLAERLKENQPSEDDIYHAAWLVLFDIWVFLRQGYPSETDTPLADILRNVSTSSNPTIMLAVALRNCFVGSNNAAVQFCDLMSNNLEIASILASIGWPTDEQIEDVTVKDPIRRRPRVPIV